MQRNIIKRIRNMDLSIIIPVYNVEKYIRACLESVFKQGLNDECFEVIIVNDGTQDNSMDVVTDFTCKHKNITIISQENQGLSVARNNGISIALGQYIIMPDSDDLLIENSLAPLLKTALDTQADLVVADFIEIFNDNLPDDSSIFQKESLRYMEKTGEELFLEDLDPSHCQVWRTLYRREFLIDNQLKFVPGIIFQDIPFTHECFIKAKKCIKASWFLNIYRKGRYGAATATFSHQKSKDYIIAIAKTWKLKQLDGISYKAKYKLEEDLYYFFYILVYKIIYSIKNTSERNGTMDFLLSAIPNLYFNHGTKQRITSFLVRHCPHLYINIYYFFAKIAYKKQ